MSRINFYMYDDLSASVTYEGSLEEARATETEAGGDGNSIIAFMSVESTNESGLDLLQAAHLAQLGNGHNSALEELVAQVFKAGVEYARTETRKKALESLGL